MSTQAKSINVGKSFRLFDFQVFDDTYSTINGTASSTSDNSSSENGSDSGGFQETKFEPKNFIIQMFGINDKGESCCIYINDYLPFFYIHVGQGWNENTMHSFMADIKQRVGKYNANQIQSYKLVDYQKLYGFTGEKKEKFIQISFQTISAMNRVKGLYYENDRDGTRRLIKLSFKGFYTSIYESSIPPLLRYFHIQNISPSGWVFVPTQKAVTPIKKTTTCTYEYICRTAQLKSLPTKETRVPYKICSFDIEASSSHGDFPVPVKTYKRLAMNIVDCYIRQSSVTKMDGFRVSAMLQKIMMTAFGFDQFENVDLVYPKRAPSKTTITNKIKILLSTAIENAKKIVDEEGDKSDVLKISKMFSNIAEQMDANEYVGDGAGGDADDDEAEEAGDADTEMEEADEEEVSAVSTTPTWKKHVEFAKTAEKQTIVEFLLSNEYKRDEKITTIDELLTLLFPRLQGDEVTFIGSTFIKYGEKEPYLNHCIVVGDCDAVEGATIECTETEVDLLLRWSELIQQENPDIIIGYNIFGFDYDFMFHRAKENNCLLDFMKMSRKTGELCVKEIENKKTGETRYEMAQTTVVLASGEYNLKYYNMSGRLQIDMYTYMRREFQLSSYKLDDVASNFISDDISKIVKEIGEDGGELTALYSSNISGLHVGDYIHIELSRFTSDYYKNGAKFRVVDIKRDHEVEEMVKGVPKKKTYNVLYIEGHEDIDCRSNIKWTMAKDDVTPQDIFRLSKGDSRDRAVVAKYCIQDCNLVHNLMSKIDVLTGYVEMSRICSVPISFLVFRGQGIKLTSYVAKKCREKNTLMPDLDKTGGNEGYEGAIVLPPKCSMYMDNPVACVDYSSLYPSSMISQNLSHDSKVWTKEFDLNGKLIRQSGQQDAAGNFIYDNLPNYQYIDLEFDQFRWVKLSATKKAEKVKYGKKICRWAQFPDGRKGIMPSILEELLKARSDTRKMAKNEKDPFMANILDKRQLGYKVTANSLYGQCGAKTSTFYEKDVAASTTATGRMMIIYARRIIEEVYGEMEYQTENHGVVRTKAEYVYGDTDSVFFTFNLEDPATGEKIRGQRALEITIDIAQDAAKLCTQWLKPPMELSYEKTLMPFILLSKKRYVGMLYETDPHKGKMKYMGLALKRRDSCDYLKDVYGDIITILMKENNIGKSVDYLNSALTRLIHGEVPMSKLMITKALKSDYKNPQQIAHYVLAERIGKRDPGNKPKAGDRIKYLYYANPNKKALQGEKIETPEFVVENKLPVDYAFYITNQLMKPLQQLFGLALEQIWEFQNKLPTLKKFQKEMDDLRKEYPSLELFMKAKEKCCSKKVKALLFDNYLIQIQNQRNGVRELSSYFTGGCRPPVTPRVGKSIV